MIWDLHEFDCKNAFHFQAFLATQERGILESLVIELACNGQGSVQFLKDMVNYIKDEYQHVDGDGEAPEWCKCGVCRPLKSEEENICCGRELCVSSYQMFKQCIINRELFPFRSPYLPWDTPPNPFLSPIFPVNTSSDSSYADEVAATPSRVVVEAPKLKKARNNGMVRMTRGEVYARGECWTICSGTPDADV